MNYMGFWRRFAALVLDGLMLMVVQMALFFMFVPSLLPRFLQDIDSPPDETKISTMMSGVFDQFTLFYFVFWLIVSVAVMVFYRCKWQATPGLKLLGGKVVSVSGEVLSSGKALLRGGLMYSQMLVAAISCYVLSKADFGMLASYSQRDLEQLSPEEVTLLQEASVQAMVAAGAANLLMFSFMILYIISAIMVGVTREKKGIHDMICGSRVVFAKDA